jgi:hypothetical protein
MRRATLPAWTRNPDPLERRILTATTGDRALVRLRRLRDDGPTDPGPEVVDLYVQGDPGGNRLITPRNRSWAEYILSDYERDGKFVSEDYLMEIIGFIDEPGDEQRLRNEARRRIAEEEGRIAAEGRAMEDALGDAFGGIRFA